MKALLLLLLASASAVFGKSLAASNLLIADEGTADLDIDQSNFDLRLSRTTNDYFPSNIFPEAVQNTIGESSEADLAVSSETEEDEPSNYNQVEQDEHLLSSDEWLQRMDDDYDWNVENRVRDSGEQSYFDGHRNSFDYLPYDFNPSWWRAQQGPMVVQPIVIPVQFAFGQQDYYRRRILY